MRVVRALLGILLVTVAVLAFTAGGALWTASGHEASDGAFDAVVSGLSTSGYALVAPDVDQLLRNQAPFARSGRTTLTLRATLPAGPAFIGLAPLAAVQTYLGPVPYGTVGAIHVGLGGLPVSVTQVAGVVDDRDKSLVGGARTSGVPAAGVPGGIPATQRFWTSSGVGQLTWTPSRYRDTPLALVIMRTDAGAGVAARARMEVRLTWLAGTTYASFSVGTAAIMCAVAVLLWPSRRREIVYVVEPSQLPEIAEALGVTLDALTDEVRRAPAQSHRGRRRRPGAALADGDLVDAAGAAVSNAAVSNAGVSNAGMPGAGMPGAGFGTPTRATSEVPAPRIPSSPTERGSGDSSISTESAGSAGHGPTASTDAVAAANVAAANDATAAVNEAAAAEAAASDAAAAEAMAAKAAAAEVAATEAAEAAAEAEAVRWAYTEYAKLTYADRIAARLAGDFGQWARQRVRERQADSWALTEAGSPAASPDRTPPVADTNLAETNSAETNLAETNRAETNRAETNLGEICRIDAETVDTGEIDATVPADAVPMEVWWSGGAHAAPIPRADADIVALFADPRTRPATLRAAMLLHPPTATNVRGTYRTHGSPPPVTPEFRWLRKANEEAAD